MDLSLLDIPLKIIALISGVLGVPIAFIKLKHLIKGHRNINNPAENQEENKQNAKPLNEMRDVIQQRDLLLLDRDEKLYCPWCFLEGKLFPMQRTEFRWLSNNTYECVKCKKQKKRF